MTNHPASSKRSPKSLFAKSEIPALIAMGALGVTSASAQDLLDTLPTTPSGFTSEDVAYSTAQSVAQGLAYGVTTSAKYDSNVTQADGGPGREKFDDVIIGLGGNVGYTTLGPLWRFKAHYSANYDWYTNESDLSGLSHRGNIGIGYTGPKLSADFSTGLGIERGGNRYYASFIEETRYFSDLNARYELSSKTSLNAYATYRTSQAEEESDGPPARDTESFETGIGALWKYSSLTELGPGIRYTLRTGDDRPDRESVGPTFDFNYELTAKTKFVSRVGVDFVDYSDGGSADPMFSGSIGLQYTASELWNMSLALSRDARADAISADAYSEITALRLDYSRKIRRAVLGLGASYEISSQEQTSEDATPRDDRNYFSIDADYTMPVFATAQASVFAKYRVSSSDTAQDDWDGYIIGVSLTKDF